MVTINFSTYWTKTHFFLLKYFDANVAVSALDYVPLVDATNISIDAANGINFSLTIGGNRTLDFPSNTSFVVGRSGFIKVKQDGGGGRTLSFDAFGYVFDSNTAPSINSQPNLTSLLAYHVITSNNVLISMPASGFNV